MRSVKFFGLLIFLSGCVAKPQIPEGREDAYYRDRYACYEALAHRTARVNKGAYLDACMRSKGWR